MVTIDFIIRIDGILYLNHGDQEFRFRTAPVVVRNDRVSEVILVPANVRRSSFITSDYAGCGWVSFFYPLENVSRGKPRRTKGGGPDRIQWIGRESVWQKKC